MQKSTRLYLAISVAVLALTVSTLATPTPAANAAEKEQCVVNVVGKSADDTFILGPETCYATFAEVLKSLGDVNVSSSARPESMSSARLSALSIIGIHYENANFGGASYTVSGSDCNGGGLNLPSGWNDRISSTANGCPQIVHYENANYGGATFSTFGGGGNITGYMNDRTTSIKYFS